jgi:hypothetical protein
METWFPPWVSKLGAVLGLLLTVVGFVRLVVSGWSAYADVLKWSGVAAAALFSLLALIGAVWPNREVTGKQRIVYAAIAVFLPIVTASVAAHGDDSLLMILGVTLYFVTASALYGIYEAWVHARAASIKECPDCLETVKRGARVCRYCGYRWPEEQPELT